MVATSETELVTGERSMSTLCFISDAILKMSLGVPFLLLFERVIVA